MSEVIPTRRVQGNPSKDDTEERVPVGSKCGTTTPLLKTSLSGPLAPTVPSPLSLGTSPSHSTHHPSHTAHTPKAATYAGMTYMVEYLREERQSSPLPLDSHIFPGGLQPGDVVEVWGNTNCGKSVLTLSLVASALLPKVWCGLGLGGCSTGVTFIDCDQHFSIFQLVNMMYKKVKAQIKLAKDALCIHRQGMTPDNTLIHSVEEVKELLQNKKASLKTKIEEMVHGCLKSLYYIKCMESVQFPVVLASMEEHLAKHSDISLVVVDSLSAFCWYDWVYHGVGKFYLLKEYYDRVLSVLLSNIRKYKVVLIAVKQALFVDVKKTSTMDRVEEEEEEPYQHQGGKEQGNEYDLDNMEGNEMENKVLSEYLGYRWVSNVTWRVILSKVRASGKSLSCVSPNGTTNTDDKGEHEEVVFSAEVTKVKQRKRLLFVIGEEGVIWKPLSSAH